MENPNLLSPIELIGELHDRIAHLESILATDTASAVARPMYEKLLDQLHTDVVDLAQDPSVKEFVIDIRDKQARVSEGLKQIDVLAEADVVSVTTIEQLRVELLGRHAVEERHATIGAYAIILMQEVVVIPVNIKPNEDVDKILLDTTPTTIEVVTTVKEVVTEPEIQLNDILDESNEDGVDNEAISHDKVSSTAEHPEPTRENAKEPKNIVATIIDDRFIRFGEAGKLTAIAPGANRSSKDYVPLRLAALKFISTTNGDITPYEFWKGFQGELPFDKDTMAKVRTWLEKLTYLKAPILHHNGLRSWGSRYSRNPSFNITFVDKFIDTPVADAKVIEDTQNITTDENVMPTVVDSITNDETSNNSIDTLYDNFVTPRQASLFMQFLMTRRATLENYGIPVPSKEIVENIEKMAVDFELSQGYGNPKKNDDEVCAERLEAITTIKEVVSDLNIFEKLVLDTPSDSPLYGLLDYLMLIDGEEQWQTIADLLELELKSHYTVIQDKSRQLIVNYQHDNDPLGRFKKPYTIPSHSTIEVLTTTEQLEEIHPEQVIEILHDDVVVQVIDTVLPATTEQVTIVPTVKEQRIATLQNTITDTVKRLAEGKLDRTTMVTLLSKGFTFVNKTNHERAIGKISNGGDNSGGKLLSIEDTISILMVSNNEYTNVSNIYRKEYREMIRNARTTYNELVSKSDKK